LFPLTDCSRTWILARGPGRRGEGGEREKSYGESVTSVARVYRASDLPILAIEARRRQWRRRWWRRRRGRRRRRRRKSEEGGRQEEEEEEEEEKEEEEEEEEEEGVVAARSGEGAE